MKRYRIDIISLKNIKKFKKNYSYFLRFAAAYREFKKAIEKHIENERKKGV